MYPPSRLLTPVTCGRDLTVTSVLRLEEQLYLERLGLLRPGLGVGSLSSAGLSAYSPLLTAARYPPELLHSPLYLSQSLYLQER